MTDEHEDRPFARAILAALQITALALCLLVLSEMAWQGVSIPPLMCIDNGKPAP